MLKATKKNCFHTTHDRAPRPSRVDGGHDAPFAARLANRDEVDVTAGVQHGRNPARREQRRHLLLLPRLPLASKSQQLRYDPGCTGGALLTKIASYLKKTLLTSMFVMPCGAV